MKTLKPILSNSLVRPFTVLSRWLGLSAVACGAMALTAAAAPAIIPLPVQMQVNAGVFTLCPLRPVQTTPAITTTKILIDSSATLATGQYLESMLSRSTGYQFPMATNSAVGPIRGAILLTTTNALTSLGAEGYELTVTPDAVVIRAPTQAGLFYGIQSLLQLLPPQIMTPQVVTNVAWTVPCVYIQDQPRFPWRGIMLDVARHFVDKQEVERILDGMALHKMNSFHWHLVDDQGWRIEILAYPALTTNTGWRTSMDYGQNPSASTSYNAAGKYGGYYTQNDIREVVAYAAQRHINIVPEIELPAHCTSAAYAYPQLGCGNAQSSYSLDHISYGISLLSLATTNYTSGITNNWAFFYGVLNEVMALFPGQYIHTGGDEVNSAGDSQWVNYQPDINQMTNIGIPLTMQATNVTLCRTKYQHWFSTNLASFLTANGRQMVAWSEFEAGGIVTNAVLMEWQTGSTSYFTNATAAGQYVVMSQNANCYINYYEDKGVNSTNYDPYFVVGGVPQYQVLTNVYGYEPIPNSLTNTLATNHILGAQCNLWTEYVPSPLNVEFKLFPRICAMAEVTWTPKAQKNLTDFTNRLTTDVQRLAAMGLNYNHGVIPQIGSWSNNVPTAGTNVSYDITPYVTKGGEIDVSFAYVSGSDGLNITSVALLENGVQVDINTFLGFAGATVFLDVVSSDVPVYGLPYYIVHLPWYHPGAVYTIQAAISEHGNNNNTYGKVFLPNWN